MMKDSIAARILAHAIVLIGILVVAFPIYFVFIGSTLSTVEILKPPLPILPGSHMIENYTEAFSTGARRVGGVSLGQIMLNTGIVAVAIAVGKIVISIL